MADQKVLCSSFCKEYIWRSPCGITVIFYPEKKHFYPIVRLSNLSLAWISSKQALGLFPQQLHLLKLSILFYIQKVIFIFTFQQRAAVLCFFTCNLPLTFYNFTSCQTQNSWSKVLLGWCEWCSWSCFPNCSKTATGSMGTKGTFGKLSVFQLCLANESFHTLCFPFFKVQIFTYSQCYHLFLLLLAHAWEWRECCWTEQGNENSSIYLAVLCLSFPSKPGCFLTCSSLLFSPSLWFWGHLLKVFL